MASAGLLNKKPVFVVTNFGTRIVIVVSVDCTIGHFKEEFENAHFNCFPELGNITVETLKIRRRSCFYDLPELFPLKHAFEGAKGWFLHVVARSAENPSAYKKIDKRLKRRRWKKRKKSPQCFKAACFKVSKAMYLLTRSKKIWHTKKKIRDFEDQINGIDPEPLKSGEDRVQALGSNSDGDMDMQAILGAEKDCHSESISETVSVSGIINRYFSGYDEVNSNTRLSFMGNIEQVKTKRAVDYQNIPSPLAPRTPVQIHCKNHHGTNRRSFEGKSGNGVGVRVVEASRSFGLSTSRKSIAHSLSKFIDGGSMVTGSDNTHVRRLIFEIPDDDD